MSDLDLDDLLDQVTTAPAPTQPQQTTVVRYLGRTGVAHYLGLRSMRSLSGVKLPPHDAEIGDRKGWLPETIDAWKATRPGRGWWGAR